jgi:protein-S-isoprenylcysteine O-methyltransferase Ste14
VPPPAPPGTRPRVRELPLALLLLAAAIALPFLCAGTLRWPAGWAFVAATAAGLALHRLHVARRNPGLFARRDAAGAGGAAWDRAWLAAFWPLMLAVPAAAGLELRLGGRPLPAWLWPAGALLFGLAMALSAAAMAVNPYFEGAARIQSDLGQRVVDAGPYRRVRHPGYAGLALWPLSAPVLLLSRWAFAPGALAAAWVVLRTALEDRMLRRELAGYADYARRVRWRLLPGVW